MHKYFVTRLAAASLLISALIHCGTEKKDEKKVNPTVEGSALSDQYTARIEWLTGPKVEDYSSAKLTFVSNLGSIPNKVEKIEFEPMMPTHGHGTFMDDQKITPVAGSSYEFVIEGIYFIMKGQGADHWVINISAQIDGQPFKTELSVDVP